MQNFNLEERVQKESNIRNITSYRLLWNQLEIQYYKHMTRYKRQWQKGRVILKAKYEGANSNEMSKIANVEQITKRVKIKKQNSKSKEWMTKRRIQKEIYDNEWVCHLTNDKRTKN